MKKGFLYLLIAILLFSICACSDKKEISLKVGMITDSSPVDDGGINAAVWNSILAASEKYNITYQYAVPEAADTDSVLDCISQLYDSGCRMIVAPTYRLADAVSSAQSKYTDCKFICVDFTLSKLKSNTISIDFSEHESGFIAGIAAALTINTGSFGAILGMDIPSARRYYNGFSYGVDYANKQLGTNISIDEKNVIYVGSYNDEKLASELANSMYENEVKCILTDGGKTADGVFSAAKDMRRQQKASWVIGSAVDCFNKGLFSANDSVTLTSAVNRIDTALDSVLASYFDNSIKYGNLLYFTSLEQAVGIPYSNPNLSDEIEKTCNNVLNKLSKGDLTIPDSESLLN